MLALANHRAGELPCHRHEQAPGEEALRVNRRDPPHASSAERALQREDDTEPGLPPAAPADQNAEACGVSRDLKLSRVQRRKTHRQRQAREHRATRG